MFEDKSKDGKERRFCWHFEIDHKFSPGEDLDAWEESLGVKIDDAISDGDTSAVYVGLNDEAPTLHIYFYGTRKLSGKQSIWVDDEATEYDEDCDDVWENEAVTFEDLIKDLTGSDMTKSSFQINPRYCMYWVETEEHDEDWFVVAEDEIAACEYFDEYEGMESEDEMPFSGTYTDWRIPEEFVDANAKLFENGPFHPQKDLIELCGGRFIREQQPQVVEFQTEGQEPEHYVEGYRDHMIAQMHDDQFEARGQGRINGTDPRTVN